MLKKGLISVAGVALGLGMAVALAAPDSAVLGLSGLASTSDDTALTVTPTSTATMVATETATATPVETAVPTATATPTATAIATTEPTLTPTTVVNPTATPTVIPTATGAATLTPTAIRTGTNTLEASSTPRNHGQYVSDVAHSAPQGPEHGAAVSAAARSDVGKKGATDADDDSDVNSDDDADTGTEDTVTIVATPTAAPVDAAGKEGKQPKAKKNVHP